MSRVAALGSRVDLDARQFVLVPEGADRTVHGEGGPGAAVAHTLVVLGAVVRVSRVSGQTLRAVVAQRTLF